VEVSKSRAPGNLSRACRPTAVCAGTCPHPRVRQDAPAAARLLADVHRPKWPPSQHRSC